MKKISLLISGIIVISPIFAYTSTDVEVANSLAKANIIVDQSSSPDKYRLDETITRQEMIGIALRLKGVALPSNYTCKGYFTDATFQSNSTDSWVCRAVELAADRGLITRVNATTRPKDLITRAEALALAWKATGLKIETAPNDGKVFYDEKNVAAEVWQNNLLRSALASSIINPETTGDKLLWKHNTAITRKEAFLLISRLLTVKTAINQTLYLNFSGEVQYIPDKAISLNTNLSGKLGEKDFESVLATLSPAPIQYRTEGNTLFIMQFSPDLWGQVIYSSISEHGGKVLQLFSSYNPYEKAVKAMLKKFNIASETDFYNLPYGETWEKTRDFIEQFYIDEFMNAPLIYPSE